MKKDLLSSAEAAEVLGVSPGRVRQFVAERRLPVAERIGPVNLYRRGDVDALRGRAQGWPKGKKRKPKKGKRR